MSKITKDNKGITLIILVVTIVIMAILLSVVTYTGIDAYRTAKVTRFITEMQLIQAQVDEYVKDGGTPAGSSLTLDQQEIIGYAYAHEEISTNTNFKYFSADDLMSFFDTLDEIENNVMINFTTREVVSETGIEYDGILYYTQYKLPNGQTVTGTDSVIIRTATTTVNSANDGLNTTVSIVNSLNNYSLMYKEQNDNYWNTITNYTESGKTYNVVISKSGLYSFKVMDNTNTEVINTTQALIRVANRPKTDATLEYDYSSDDIEDWATLDGYIWIPRFAFKENINQDGYDIKFIKGNSNIATDNTYVTDDWTVPGIFLKNGQKLTGIWVDSQQITDIEDIIDNTVTTGEEEVLESS